MLTSLADEHVKQLIVAGLRRGQMDVVTVGDIGLRQASDEQLLAYAGSNRRVMLTNDSDFLILASQHWKRGESFAPIFFWQQQGRANREIVESILRQARHQIYDEIVGTVLYV